MTTQIKTRQAEACPTDAPAPRCIRHRVRFSDFVECLGVSPHGRQNIASSHVSDRPIRRDLDGRFRFRERLIEFLFAHQFHGQVFVGQRGHLRQINLPLVDEDGIRDQCRWRDSLKREIRIHPIRPPVGSR